MVSSGSAITLVFRGYRRSWYRLGSCSPGSWVVFVVRVGFRCVFDSGKFPLLFFLCLVVLIGCVVDSVCCWFIFVFAYFVFGPCRFPLGREATAARRCTSRAYRRMDARTLSMHLMDPDSLAILSAPKMSQSSPPAGPHRRRRGYT